MNPNDRAADGREQDRGTEGVAPGLRKRIIVAITGASGALYAKRLLETLAAAEIEVFLIVSQIGRRLLHEELGMEQLDLAALAGRGDHRITLLPYKDVGACVASGSFKNDGMVVIPCSNNKLAEFAHGLGDNLIGRAVQVTLKERRPLVIVHREMPLGIIEIKNMLELAQAGAIICPANPGFYTLPRSVDDLVNNVVGRVLDLLGVEHQLHGRWNGKLPESDAAIHDLQSKQYDRSYDAFRLNRELILSADILSAIRQFPTEITFTHCEAVQSTSSLTVYGVCCKCGAKVKLRGFSGVTELQDVFDAMFEWLNKPGAEHAMRKRLEEISLDGRFGRDG